MVEKFVQLGPDIVDKEETGVESALYIFVPSLMSDQVWFGAPAQPLDTDPRPSKVRNTPQSLPREQLWLFLCTSRLPEEAPGKLGHCEVRGWRGVRWCETRLPRPWEVA